MSAENERTEPKPGQFAYEGLDRIMHEKARLGILTSLASRPEGLLFNELKELCALTDGNLSRHVRTLQDAGLVEVWKGFHKRRPQTLCRLSAEGRRRFFEYLDELEKVVAAAASAKKAMNREQDTATDLFQEGWTSA